MVNEIFFRCSRHRKQFLASSLPPHTHSYFRFWRSPYLFNNSRRDWSNSVHSTASSFGSDNVYMDKRPFVWWASFWPFHHGRRSLHVFVTCRVSCSHIFKRSFNFASCFLRESFYDSDRVSGRLSPPLFIAMTHRKVASPFETFEYVLWQGNW